MLEKLEPRERTVVIGGAVVALLALAFLGGSWFVRARAQIAQRVQQSRVIAGEMTQLKRQILSMQAANPLPEQSSFLQNVNNSLTKFNLNSSSFQETGTQTQNGQTTYGVNIRLAQVRLEDLIKFLHEMEYPRELPAPVVDNIKIQRAPSGREVYEVTMTITLTGAAR